jgi:hypothetical protein
MFLVGIWHGAGWNFVVYALLQATAMVFHRFTRPKAVAWGFRFARVVLASASMALAAAAFAVFALRWPDPWVAAQVVGVLALGIGLLPGAERFPALGPIHVFLTLHFSVLSRIFFRADTLDAARSMANKVLNWDGFGVRTGLLGNERLSEWLAQMPLLGWARPLGDWCVLGLLVLGFALHYTPARRLELAALSFAPRVPAVAAGVGFAVLAGVLGLLLAGPRANIYFAF